MKAQRQNWILSVDPLVWALIAAGAGLALAYIYCICGIAGTC
jgi:hypothetical protein